MDDLETNLKNPNVQAFLSTIANTEGATYNSLRNARDGSKRTFDDYARYPGETSGRYQIIPTTYAGLRAKLGRDDYSPHTQDLMAIQRIIDRGAMPSLLSGDLDAVLPKVAPEWASLEKGRGAGNAYKAQHYVPYDRIRAIFDLNRSP
jgi:muramidase (phage lysozyme)